MSRSFRLLVPRDLYDAMIAQAFAELPNECCGLFAGYIEEIEFADRTVRVARRYPLTNALADPREFLSDARSMFDAVRDVRRNGLEVVAVYHSHPTSAAVPSKKDLDRNYSPDVMNYIVSLAGGVPMVRAWWLTETDYREAEWRVVEPLVAENSG